MPETIRLVDKMPDLEEIKKIIGASAEHVEKSLHFDRPKRRVNPLIRTIEHMDVVCWDVVDPTPFYGKPDTDTKPVGASMGIRAMVSANPIKWVMPRYKKPV